MSFELEHPNLTAYALGQLEGDMRARTEELLASNEEARARLEEIRATVGSVQQVFAREADAELRADQIGRIRAALEGPHAPDVLPVSPSKVELPIATAGSRSVSEPRSRKRSAWMVPAAMAAAVGAIAIGAWLAGHALKPKDQPIVALAKPAAPDSTDFQALLRERAKHDDSTHASAIAPAFRFDDARAIKPNLSQDAPLGLTASDGTGLKLTSLSARVVIEEPLAFTELHLSFANPESRTIEGRFAITLPEGATISRFAMRMSGDRWQEGEIVERQAARATYEDFLHRRQDPALLEQAGGNEFTARIFPIPPRSTKEIIVSYSHELVRVDEPYRLALAGLPEIGETDIRAVMMRSGDASSAAPVESNIVDLHKLKWVPDQDFVVPQSHKEGRLGLRSENMVVARIAPIPDSQPDEIRSLFVFFDTSASNALGFSARVRLLKNLINGLASGANPEVPIAIACFDQRVELVYEGPARGFTADHVRRIEDRTALGASDFSAALDFFRDRSKGAGHHFARILFISDGVATAGEIDKSKLVESVRGLRSVEVERLDAIATGGIRDRALLDRLVTAGLPRDGTVSDERWDLQRIAAKLSERTYSGVKVEVEGAAWVWPETLNGIQAGDQVLVYSDLPAEKSFRLSLAGAALSIADRSLTKTERPLLERAFAKARIDRLTNAMDTSRSGDADEKAALQRQIVEVSTKSRVLSPFTALVVLETDADYARFGIDRRALSDVLTVANDRVAVAPRASYASIGMKQPTRTGAVASRGSDDSDARWNSGQKKGKAKAQEPAKPSEPTPDALNRSEDNKGPAEPNEKSSSADRMAKREMIPVPVRAEPPADSAAANAEGAVGDGLSGGGGAIMGSSSGLSGAGSQGAADNGRHAPSSGVLGGARAPASDEEVAQAESEPPPAPATERPAFYEAEKAKPEPKADRKAASVEPTTKSKAEVAIAEIQRVESGLRGVDLAKSHGAGSIGSRNGAIANNSSAGSTPHTFGVVGDLESSKRRSAAGTSAHPMPKVADEVRARESSPANYGLTAAVVSNMFRAKRAQLNACMAELRSAPANLGNRVEIGFSVRPSGAIEGVSLKPARVASTAFGRCIAARVSTFRFPSFYGPPQQLSVPFAFTAPAPRRSEIFRDPYQGPFAEVMRLLQRGDRPAALGRAQRWRTEAPGDVLALVALGEACEANGDRPRAERVYGSIIDLFPSRADLRRFAGERLDRIQSPDALKLAEDTYHKAALDRPDHPTGRRLHAYSLLKLGRTREAFEEIESVLTRGNGLSRAGLARYVAALQVLREDIGLIGMAWTRAEPTRAAEIRARVVGAGGAPEDGPSLRFVLNWETDANDVDLHVYDALGGHTFYGQLALPSGGRHYGGVFTGYGPECVSVPLPRARRAAPYQVRVHYYARGPMGYGMGSVQIIEHDGEGNLTFDTRPFVAMTDSALIDLGSVR